MMKKRFYNFGIWDFCSMGGDEGGGGFAKI